MSPAGTRHAVSLMKQADRAASDTGGLCHDIVWRVCYDQAIETGGKGENQGAYGNTQ
jgi:hypothetical protein